ncbi:MAG: DUF1501 domain-containing protein [Paludisphaera borealis]|uniref:DUF1501 domain-containing protein n=1 Tax=Paludisphaera borealis TaxID=1387353 RepID=UPI002842637F|nr:DUF1501 domain-containing protein [Paludisphaera borealis]MDR3618956.1 DUF1501 domain-containing protein [Paludisphaera borealis]
MRRREFLRTGLAGLSLPQLLALRARAGTPSTGDRTALIVVWLQGGASHLETYDPKPDAPAEIRGPFGSIATKAEGVRISELLPLHATVADKFAILRSLSHSGFCHQQGNQQMFTGHPEQTLKLKPDHPDLMCIAHRARSDPSRRVPSYVGVNPIPYLGSAYLGPAFEPFSVYGDPNAPGFSVPGIGLADPAEIARLERRKGLATGFDGLLRAMDDPAQSEAFDSFQRQAFALTAGPEARRAFDLDKEDPRLRDRYGRNTWGQRCLLARRLVEAGVDLVATSLDGPLCGRIGNWDDHAVNHHVFDAMKARCQYFDQAVSALIEDVHARGLDRRVLVVVTGEFGRTPKISYDKDSASGVKQPGRDHWPRAVSLLMSGGGIPGGQVVGATDPHGADVTSRRVGVRDFLATIYRHLGIDAESLVINDRTGRPVLALPEGSPIPELTRI